MKRHLEEEENDNNIGRRKEKKSRVKSKIHNKESTDYSKNNCELCTLKSTIKCLSCNLVFYCSKRCQDLDSIEHHSICKSKATKKPNEVAIQSCELTDDTLKKVFSFLPNSCHFPLHFVSKHWQKNMPVNWDKFDIFVLGVLFNQNDNVKLYSWAIKTIGMENITNHAIKSEGCSFLSLATEYQPNHFGTLNMFDIFYSIIKNSDKIANSILESTIFQDGEPSKSCGTLPIVSWINKNMHPSEFMESYVSLMESIISYYIGLEGSMELTFLIDFMSHLLPKNIVIGIILNLNDFIFRLKGFTLKRPSAFRWGQIRTDAISNINYQQLVSTDWKINLVSSITTNININNNTSNSDD